MLTSWQVQFPCNAIYDLLHMGDNELAYGSSLANHGSAYSEPGLWAQTREFIMPFRSLLHLESTYWWLNPNRPGTSSAQDASVSNPRQTSGGLIHDSVAGRFTGENSNVQGPGDSRDGKSHCTSDIGSLDFFRRKDYKTYFDYLHQAGGFYFERCGEIGVHEIGDNMLLPQRRLWVLRGTGHTNGMYYSGFLRHDKASHYEVDARSTDPFSRQNIGSPNLHPDSGHPWPFATAWRPAPKDPHHHSEAPDPSPHSIWRNIFLDLKRQRTIPTPPAGYTISALDVKFGPLLPRQSQQQQRLAWQIPYDNLRPRTRRVRRWFGGDWLERRLLTWSLESSKRTGTVEWAMEESIDNDDNQVHGMPL